MKPLEDTDQLTPQAILRPGFVHVVLFWLKPDLSDQQIAEFETGLNQYLQDSDFASTGFVGIPANTPREVVDSSYDYCLIVSFENAEQHQAYQDEPAHDTFREIAGRLAERVQIYDSLTTKK